MFPPFFHYKKFNRNHLESLLINRTIKLSRADEFNDPWELKYHVAVPTTDDDRETHLKWFADSHRAQCPHIGEAERNQIISEIRSNKISLSAIIKKTAEQVCQHLADQYRIYCLTTNPASLLMWAHYADSHRGICIGYEPNNPGFPLIKYTQKVIYASQFPVYGIHANDIGPLITKSSDWQYEDEYRLLAEERNYATTPLTLKTDNSYLKFPAPIVQCIIIGARAEPSVKSEIMDVIQKSNSRIALVQSVIPPDRYSLTFETIG